MDKFNFRKDIFHSLKTMDDVIFKIDAIVSSERVEANIIPFSTFLNPDDVMNNVNYRTAKIKAIKRINDNRQIYIYDIKYKARIKDEQIKRGHLIICRHNKFDNVFLAFVLDDNELAKDILQPLIERAYPSFFMTFITNNKLKRYLTSFEKEEGIRKMIIRKVVRGYRLGSQSKTASGIEWADLSMGEAFDLIEKDRGWFKSIKFDVFGAFKCTGNVTFTRTGVARTNQLFQKIMKDFIFPVCNELNTNIEVFKNRGRNENRDLFINPLAISFEEGQFSDVEENKVFIQAMKKYKKASVSVMHGNPYINMSVVDYYDGSTFDLWVLDENELVVVPQMQASVPAIKRIINHVFDNYAEGDIKTYNGSAV